MNNVLKRFVLYIAALPIFLLMAAGIVAYAKNAQPTVQWIGYIAATNASNPARSVTFVNGSWIVPLLGPGLFARTFHLPWDAKEWIGIGGYDNDPTIVQIGTETTYYGNDTTSYYAWYEYFNSSYRTTNRKKVIANFTINPGDIMYASVKCIANCSSSPQRWSVILEDVSAREKFQNASVFNATRTYADWVVEVLPKADIFSQYFVNMTHVFFGQAYTGIESDYATVGNITGPIGLLNHSRINQSDIEHASGLYDNASFTIR